MATSLSSHLSSNFIRKGSSCLPFPVHPFGRIIVGGSLAAYRVMRQLSSDWTKMTHLTVVATSFFLLFAYNQACSLQFPVSGRSSCSLHMVPPEGPAGSFFHQIPDEPNEGDVLPTLDSSDDINDEVVELLRQRRKPARAYNPSTINGVPTQKTTGESLL